MSKKKSNPKVQNKPGAKKSLKGGKKLGETRLMWTLMKG